MCLLNKDFYERFDWNDFGLLLILVTKTDLGTINHTLMSLEIIKYKRINLHGIIFIGDQQKDTVDYIKILEKIY